jgi:hypothetical protein
MLGKTLLISLLTACALASPVGKRADQKVVAGRLGTDSFWNDYDGGLNNYTMYTGNGSSAASWPRLEHWVSYAAMWNASQHLISRSCDILYNATNNSDEETQTLYDAIAIVSRETRVDHRFILAAIMQETKGCVRAITTESPDGIRNPGILQSFKGTHSCNDIDKKPQVPCPRDVIIGQVRDGVAGTDEGDDAHGFAVDINLQADVEGVEFAEAYYRAARVYNSGAIDDSGDLGEGKGTRCYVSDLANRLTGWVDSDHHCDLDGEGH